MAAKLTQTASGDAGLTLIELLVVITCLSVLAVGVSLTAFRSDQPAISDRDWFRTQFDTARNLSIQARQPRGLNVSGAGLRIAQMQGGEWEIKPPARPWSGTVTIARMTPLSGQGTPEIVLLANGQSTAFDIVFAGRDETPRRCSSDGWTGLICAGD